MRKLRNLQPGATYHVASKIDHGAMALKDPDIKQAFLDMVAAAKKKFAFELWNFTVLDNHIHFLIKPGPGVSLSKIMQWLKCNFAKKWNKAHGTYGHLWGDRFFSRIIKNEKDFNDVNDYIDDNPVEAGLVADAARWIFGGLFHRLNGIRGLIDTLWGSEFSFTINQTVLNDVVTVTVCDKSKCRRPVAATLGTIISLLDVITCGYSSFLKRQRYSMAIKTNNKKSVKAHNPTFEEWGRRFKEHPFLFCGTILILVIVIVAFVLVPALPGVGGGSVSVEFGKYGKTPIALVPGNYFAQQVQNYENTYRFYYGSSYDASNMFLSYQIWRQAFEDTVIHVAALEEMKNAGYSAPSEVVDREVAALPLFQENGRFSSIRYRELDNTKRLALWREVRDSITEQRYISATVDSLPVSSKEAAFISAMGSKQRTFSMALFSLYDYPDSELASFVTANSGLFRVAHLSRVTLNSNEREAQQILTSVQDGTSTFEDAARNHSQDSFAETGGDMGVKMAHELTSEIPSEENRELLLNLAKGELSPVIPLASGWAFFRAEEEPHAPDMTDTVMVAKAKLYIMDFERGRVEDWYIARANTLISSIKEVGLEEALTQAEMEATSFGPVPLNYGNVSLFTTLDSLSDASAISGTAATDENFWRTAFSTPVDTPSQPIVIGSHVAVLYPVSETPLDDASVSAIEDSYPSRVGSLMNQALRSHVISSGKLDDRFSAAYFNNFQ